MGPAWGASDLPVTVFDRIVLPDAQSGETEDEHEKSSDPVSLCDYLLSSEERLDRSVVDAFLPGEAGAENHRNARVSIRLLHCHNWGSDLNFDGDGERNSHLAAAGLEKRGWEDVE